MGLQLQPDVFKWLQSQNLVKEGRRTAQNRIQLNDDISMKFYDGVYLGVLIKQIIKLQPDPAAFEKLDAIKENSTPAIRLYNWNILCEILKKLGCIIQYSQKSRILNLEPGPVLKVLDFLYKLQQISQAQKGQGQDQPKPLKVDILEVQKKQLRDSSNILQFFVISIARNFKLSPQHTLNLFLDNNKYLAHLLVKGVKNSFDPVEALLVDIQSSMDMIVATLFCTDQKESVEFFLNAIKPSLISKDPQVAQSCINLFSKLHQTYKLNSMSLEIIRGWIKQEGLSTIFFSIKRHPELFQHLITLTVLFLGSETFQFIQPADKSLLWDNESQKLVFFNKFLNVLSKELAAQFCESQSFAMWTKHLIKGIKKYKQVKQMAALLAVLSWIWEHLEQRFEGDENNLPNAFLGYLKTCSLHQSEVVFSESIISMFSLMEALGRKKNNCAPLIYKILINCFTFCGIPDRISFMAINFKEAFQSIKNLPGGVLVQPVLKNMQKEVSQDCITLCRVMIQEERVSDDQLIQIIELLTSIAFNDTEYGRTAIECIFDNASAMNEDMLSDYLMKNMKNSLAQFYSIASSLKRKFAELQSDYKRYGNEESMKKGPNTFTDQIKKHILLGNLVLFYQRCAEESEEAKMTSEPLLFHTYIRVKNTLRKQQQSQLLMPLMKLYYQDDEDLQRQIIQYEDELKPPKQQEEELRMDSSLNKQSIMSKSHQVSQEPSSKVLDLSTLKPSSYAIKDLEKVKKKVEHLKTMEEKKGKEKDLMQEKKQLFRSVLNEKRIVEFGVKNVKNIEYKCLHEEGTAKEEDPSRTYGVPNIKLMDLSQEEEVAFVEDTDSIMKKYRKVWRFLFFKYSSFGARNKEEMKTQEKINMAEVWKMLRQYDCPIVKKEESHAIVRMINDAMKRKNDLQNLTYLGFEEYIFQLCNYGYGKTGYSHLPPGQKVRLFIQQLKHVTAQKGGNVDLFQNPEEVYFQQTDVIREFNKKLKENAQYILPEGYKKVKLTELYYDYQIHPAHFQGFPSAYKEVIQVLDQIFSQCAGLGFHLIQPLTHKQEKSIAKPCLFQNLAQKMKDYSKGYLQPKLLSPSIEAKEKQKTSFKHEFHPHINFSIGIKLGLAGVSIKNRFIADQVAYWMDDMLDSIQQGSSTVANKAKKRIDNQILKKKRASLYKMKAQQKNQQLKWRKRAESVKAEVNQIQQKRKQTDVKNRQQRKLKRKVQKQKQQNQIKKKLQQFKIAKQKLQEKRKQQENKKKQEGQKKKKEKQQYKKGVDQYFKKKKEELQQKQATIKKNKEDQFKRNEQEEKKKKEFVKKLHMNILKKQEGVLQKIEETKKGFDQIWTSKQIQDKLLEYDVPLKLLFQLLLKHEKSKISGTNNDELSLNTLQFFAIKFKIVPFMIQKNTLAKIFKIVGRSNQATSGVNFKGFKQTLFRITVKSKQLLNGIIEKKKQKQKQIAKFMTKKSSEGNHYQIEENQQAFGQKGESVNLGSPKKHSVTDEYLFNADGVSVETIDQMLKFLNLPKDRLSMDQRYRQAMEDKAGKPKNVLIKELKSSLQ